MKKLLFISVLLLVMIVSVQAATIKGKVYDFSLEPASALIEIGTKPVQKQVADPDYSFEVEPGTYNITARNIQNGRIKSIARESVTISEEGVYNLDLILFPDLDIDDPIEDPDLNPGIFNPPNINIGLIILIGILIIAGTLILFMTVRNLRKDVEEKIEKGPSAKTLVLDEDAQKILDYVSEHKRVTQKEIREMSTLSEGKISLILSELEEKGLIEKIRKGRGNIIVKK